MLKLGGTTTRSCQLPSWKVRPNLPFQIVFSRSDFACFQEVAQKSIKPSERQLKYLREQLLHGQIFEKLFTEILVCALLNPNLSGANQLIENLYKSREMCTQQVTTTLQALSPIQWVPNEILTAIFFYCLPDDYRFSPTLGPLSLCHVCKVWRTLTLSNPSLWRKISFWSPAMSTRDPLCYPIRLVNKWLAHSGTLPLEFFFEDGMCRNHVKTFTELVLLEHYSRCQYLELAVTQMSSLGLINFIDLPAGSLSQLECLVLDGLDEAVFSLEEDSEGDDEDIPNTIMITAFESSPNLRKLTTNSLDFMFHIGPDKIQFNLTLLPCIQLTHILITDFIDLDIFVHTLAECLALQFLRVSLTLRSRTKEPTHINHVNLPIRKVLPCLTAMYISVDGGGSFPSEMDIFRFPALTAFHFRRYSNRPAVLERFSWEESLHFCTQLNHLQYLSLTGHIGSADQVIWFLERMSTITELVLDIFVDYETLLPILFPQSMVSPLLCLAKLELHLEDQELCFPSGPGTNIFEITKGGVALRRLRTISLESSQPCLFRLREMVESIQSSPLRILRLLYVCGPPRHRALIELQKQFSSSALLTHFSKQRLSSRTGSDQDLMEDRSTQTSYTIY